VGEGGGVSQDLVRPLTVAQDIFAAIQQGDLAAVTAILDGDPGAAHARQLTRNADGTIAPGHAWPTALQKAAEAVHLPIVKLLIARGAEPYETAAWGYPAIDHAVDAKRQHIVDYFLGEGARDPRLRGAPTYGLGIDVNLAARLGWITVVQKHLALDRLAVHRRGVIGETPLHWAAHNGHVEIVTALLDAGADIEADEIGAYGGTPLHWAAEHAPRVVELLLRRGADVNSRNRLAGEFLGFTPLIMCAKQRNDCAECAELLIAGGADVEARADNGKSALAYASGGGHREVEAVLRRAGARP